ncbi:MAG: FAD-dependent oxidoreductase [Pseudomonadota bacterium]
MLLQRELGSTQEAVDANRSVEIEPALAHQHAKIAGAIYTPGECAADCLKTCEGLVAILRARGVKFLLDTPIEQLLVRGKAMVAVQTPQGPVEADQFVMALGAASAPMARSLGVDLPVYPLKGYSITVEVEDSTRAPAVSVTDSARKVVFARIGSRLRVAGMAELAGYGTGVEAAQIESLKNSTQSVFPGCSRFSELDPWAGLRPATPTARPIIGRHAKGPDNLLFNVGHGALGFTLAFGSAGRIAALLNQ